jgi:hypothetical protein
MPVIAHCAKERAGSMKFFENLFKALEGENTPETRDIELEGRAEGVSITRNDSDYDKG